MDEVSLHRHLPAFLLLVSVVAPLFVLAQPPFANQLIAETKLPSVTILSPEDGQTYPSGEEIPVRFRTELGDKAEYVRIEVNGTKGDVLPASEGEAVHRIGPLEAGRRTITLRLLNRAYADLDAGSSVVVEIE